jgi:hypothetical protein
MDQELIDASRYRIYSMSLDSRFADTYYGPNGRCVEGSCATGTNNGTSDFLIRLPSTVKNIMRISLASVELPEVEYLFSCKNGNLNFTVTVGATTKTLAITPGNYRQTDMAAEMAAVLNSAAGFGAGAFSVAVDTVTGLLSIQGPAPFTIAWQSDVQRIAERRTEWGLGYYLGFRSRTVTSTLGGLMKGVAIVRLQPAAYYLLQLMIPDQVEAITHRLQSGASIPAFGKLVLRDSWYHLQFDDNSNLLRKEYTFLTPINVSSVRARLVDAYGEVVDLADLDWSMTLEFYEVTNARTANVIGRAYERR